MSHSMPCSIYGALVTLLLAIIAPETGYGKDIFVDNADGDEVAAGYRLKSALESLSAGDTLIIGDGRYRLPEGAWVGGADAKGNFKRIDGAIDRPTVIKAQNRRKAIIRGNLEVRGAFIRIEGLVIKGAQGTNDRPGIEVGDSNNIEIVDNEVAHCGGGGINFNQSDIILVTQNLVHNNATRNADQHSGISVYQPINYSINPREAYWGVLITRNISHSNRNERPNQDNDLTDGNGIVVDDYRYTQDQYLGKYNLKNIRTDPKNPGRRLPYSRPTLIEGNLCYFNGGSGIQCFEAVDVRVKNNTCVGNRQRTMLQGKYFDLGQISLQNCSKSQVCNSVMQSLAVSISPQGTCLAASELNARGSGDNIWYNNLLHSTKQSDQKALRNNDNIDTGAIYEDPKFVSMVRGKFNFRAVNGDNRGTTWGDGHVYTDLLGRTVSEGMKTDIGAIQTVKSSTPSESP